MDRAVLSIKLTRLKSRGLSLFLLTCPDVGTQCPNWAHLLVADCRQPNRSALAKGSPCKVLVQSEVLWGAAEGVVQGEEQESSLFLLGAAQDQPIAGLVPDGA